MAQLREQQQQQRLADSDAVDGEEYEREPCKCCNRMFVYL